MPTINKRGKTIAVIVASLVILLIASAVVYMLFADKGGQSKGLEKVRVQAGWLLNGEFADVCSAITGGFYADQGLDVELIPGGPSGSNFIVATNALAQDASIDIAIDGDIIPLLRGVSGEDESKRMQLKAFATFWSDNPYGFFVRKDSGIASIEDFHKPMANGQLPKIGLTSDAVIQYAIANHLSIESSDLDITTVGFDATPFISRQVDVIGGYWTTQAYELEQAGIEYDFISASTIPGFTQPSMIAIASNKTIQERPDMLRKWLAATEKGSEQVKADPEKAAKSILDPRCGGDAFDEIQEEWLIRKSIPLFTEPYGRIDIEKLEDFAKAYYGIQQIPRLPQQNEYIDTRFIEEL